MIDWDQLTAMRSVFLGERSGATSDYWTNRGALDSYDRTFAQRIGWKWDAVLADGRARGWIPPPGAVLVDWGCGTGIAARRFLSAFPDSMTVHLRDRSAAALAFAKDRLQKEQPSCSVIVDNLNAPVPSSFVLLISHVLSELSAQDEAVLGALAEKAQTVLWVEPGTPALSRRLIAWRERVRGSFHFYAPCPHQERCGLRTETNARHWCHHFAPPAPEAFTTAEWREFSRRLKIDLRSLPVSYLIADRRPALPFAHAREIGRARTHTGYATYLRCDATGVREEKVLRRNDATLVKALAETTFARYLR